eukprot:815971_1
MITVKKKEEVKPNKRRQYGTQIVEETHQFQSNDDEVQSTAALALEKANQKHDDGVGGFQDISKKKEVEAELQSEKMNQSEPIKRTFPILEPIKNLDLQSEKMNQNGSEEQKEHSPALELSREFPSVQDIVNEFDTLQSNYHVEAGKQLRKVLKHTHKEYSRLRNYKFVCEILFDILIKSYDAMKQYKNEQYRDIAVSNGFDIHDELEKKVNEVFSMYMFKKDKARAIVDDIKSSYGMNDYLTEISGAKLLEYTEECVAICWVIVLVRDPMLSIEPQEFDHSNKGTTRFDERLHIEGFGSEDKEWLNFVVWPSIVRQDTRDKL